MAAIATSAVYRGPGVNISSSQSLHPSPLFKTGYFTVPATTTVADTVTINLYENFGIQRLLGYANIQHTTANSVFVEVITGTSAVDQESLTLTTVGGTSYAKKRFFVVYGK